MRVSFFTEKKWWLIDWLAYVIPSNASHTDNTTFNNACNTGEAIFIHRDVLQFSLYCKQCKVHHAEITHLLDKIIPATPFNFLTLQQCFLLSVHHSRKKLIHYSPDIVGDTRYFNLLFGYVLVFFKFDFKKIALFFPTFTWNLF